MKIGETAESEQWLKLRENNRNLCQIKYQKNLCLEQAKTFLQGGSISSEEREEINSRGLFYFSMAKRRAREPVGHSRTYMKTLRDAAVREAIAHVRGHGGVVTEELARRFAEKRGADPTAVIAKLRNTGHL